MSGEVKPFRKLENLIGVNSLLHNEILVVCAAAFFQNKNPDFRPSKHGLESLDGLGGLTRPPSKPTKPAKPAKPSTWKPSIPYLLTAFSPK